MIAVLVVVCSVAMETNIDVLRACVVLVILGKRDGGLVVREKGSGFDEWRE